jgi:hypothetical protein
MRPRLHHPADLSMNNELSSADIARNKIRVKHGYELSFG